MSSHEQMMHARRERLKENRKRREKEKLLRKEKLEKAKQLRQKYTEDFKALNERADQLINTLTSLRQDAEPIKENLKALIQRTEQSIKELKALNESANQLPRPPSPPFIFSHTDLTLDDDIHPLPQAIDDETASVSSASKIKTDKALIDEIEDPSSDDAEQPTAPTSNQALQALTETEVKTTSTHENENLMLTEDFDKHMPVLIQFFKSKIEKLCGEYHLPYPEVLELSIEHDNDQFFISLKISSAEIIMFEKKFSKMIDDNIQDFFSEVKQVGDIELDNHDRPLFWSRTLYFNFNTLKPSLDYFYHNPNERSDFWEIVIKIKTFEKSYMHMGSESNLFFSHHHPGGVQNNKSTYLYIQDINPMAMEEEVDAQIYLQIIKDSLFLDDKHYQTLPNKPIPYLIISLQEAQYLSDTFVLRELAFIIQGKYSKADLIFQFLEKEQGEFYSVAASVTITSSHFAILEEMASQLNHILNRKHFKDTPNSISISKTLAKQLLPKLLANPIRPMQSIQDPAIQNFEILHHRYGQLLKEKDLVPREDLATANTQILQKIVVHAYASSQASPQSTLAETLFNAIQQFETQNIGKHAKSKLELTPHPEGKIHEDGAYIQYVNDECKNEEEQYLKKIIQFLYLKENSYQQFRKKNIHYLSFSKTEAKYILATFKLRQLAFMIQQHYPKIMLIVKFQKRKQDTTGYEVLIRPARAHKQAFTIMIDNLSKTLQGYAKYFNPSALKIPGSLAQEISIHLCPPLQRKNSFRNG